MESRTYFKNMRITPDKFRDVVRIVRGRKPPEAVQLLENVNKKAARSLRKIILSALSNARNTLNVGDDMLQFRLFTIEEGNRLKRYRAVSRGMARAFYRRMSHVKIILAATEDAVVAPVAKAAPKAETKKTAATPKVEPKKPAVKTEPVRAGVQAAKKNERSKVTESQ